MSSAIWTDESKVVVRGEVFKVLHIQSGERQFGH